MSLSIGQSVSGYDLIDYVDSSANRVTFRARNRALQREEQLELLPDALLGDPERSARFFRESRILSSLSHPNIVSCYGTVELGGHMAISVEAIEAVRLADRLELGPMDIDDGVRAILQVLGGVEAAHKAGVLHREISPANILITPDGVVKLTGFSAAKSAGDPNITSTGSVIGDVTFKAPELLTNSQTLDPRADIYAVGCVFYTVVTGRPPFQAASQYDTIMAHLQETPVPPSHRNPAFNALLDAVILKALSKNPDDRYQSAGEFYHSILNPGTVYVPPPPETAKPVPEPSAVPAQSAVAPAQQIGLKTIAMGALALVLIAAAWVIFLASASAAP